MSLGESTLWRRVLAHSRQLLFATVTGCVSPSADGGRTLDTPSAAASWSVPNPGDVDAARFGARGDDELDDTNAIQAALASAEAVRGARVLLPIGVLYLSDLPPLDQVALKIDRARQLTLAGAGPNRTRLVLRSKIDAHVIAISDAENVQVSDLALDGDRRERRNTHGIRVASSTDIVLRNLRIHSVAHYGIGLQRGPLRRITIERVVIDDTGGDGIDFKNTAAQNDEIVIREVQVSRPGQVAPRQAGIDIRGRAHLSQIDIRELPSGATGIRFREDGDSTGPGGHRSTLSGFRVEGAPGSSGVAIAASDVTVREGTVIGTDTGIDILGSRARISSVAVRGARYAFRVEPSGENALIDACRGDSSRAGVWLEAKAARVSRSAFRDNERCGICVRPGATDGVFSDNAFHGGSREIDDASRAASE